jgi:hypothetical protein
MDAKKLKEIIREAVREEVNILVKKELKDIKMLLAKQIIESRKQPEGVKDVNNQVVVKQKKEVIVDNTPIQGNMNEGIMSILDETRKSMTRDDFRNYGNFDSSMAQAPLPTAGETFMSAMGQSSNVKSTYATKPIEETLSDGGSALESIKSILMGKPTVNYTNVIKTMDEKIKSSRGL